MGRFGFPLFRRIQRPSELGSKVPTPWKSPARDSNVPGVRGQDSNVPANPRRKVPTPPFLADAKIHRLAAGPSIQTWKHIPVIVPDRRPQSEWWMVPRRTITLGQKHLSSRRLIWRLTSRRLAKGIHPTRSNLSFDPIIWQNNCLNRQN